MSDRRPTQYLAFVPLWDVYARRARGRGDEPTVSGLARTVGVERETVQRWRAAGRLLVHPADRAAVALGLHPIDVWGDAYLELPATADHRPRPSRRRASNVLLFPPVDWTVMRPLRAAALAESLALRGIVCAPHLAEEARTA